MLFGVCTGPTLADAHDQLKAIVKAQADGVEVRVDLFQQWDIAALKHLLSTFIGKVLITYRSSEEEPVLLSRWLELVLLRPDYVDLSIDTAPSVFMLVKDHLPKAKIIASYHGDMAGESLDDAWHKVYASKADIFKIAMVVHTTTDALKILALAQHISSQGVKIIAQGIGEYGAITRILSPVFGSYLSYAAAAGAATAKGQLDVTLMREYYSVLSAKTRLYAVIGDPIDHSLSPKLHNYLFRKKGECAYYIPLKITELELATFFFLLKTLKPFYGVSITMPHKEASIAFMDRLCIHSRSIKAVNTCVKRGGKLFGYNTDYSGFAKALIERYKVEARTWHVIGSGGAARACIYALARLGAKVFVQARSTKDFNTLTCAPYNPLQTYDYSLAAIPDTALEDYPSAIDISYHSYRPSSIGQPFFIHQALQQQRLWQQKKSESSVKEYDELFAFLFASLAL